MNRGAFLHQLDGNRATIPPHASPKLSSIICLDSQVPVLAARQVRTLKTVNDGSGPRKNQRLASPAEPGRVAQWRRRPQHPTGPPLGAPFLLLAVLLSARAAELLLPSPASVAGSVLRLVSVDVRRSRTRRPSLGVAILVGLLCSLRLRLRRRTSLLAWLQLGLHCRYRCGLVRLGGVAVPCSR